MSLPDWNILYRGSLSSCNYACDYCPFAKTKNSRAELSVDKAELVKFCDWVETRTESIGILFTPWGEALVRSYYRNAMVELSHMSNVSKVAIQTNMSCSTEWVEKADLESIAFWITYHPGECEEQRFIEKCLSLTEMGATYSVGIVGMKEHLGDIEKLRDKLPSQVYLWVNAYKREPHYYQPDDLKLITDIDPYFKLNTRYHPSYGKACKAGHRSFTVDGNGDAKRCHFISQSIGNIYQSDFDQQLVPRSCSTAQCGCHIGYINLEKLKLNKLFGSGLLERVPENWPMINEEYSG